MEKQYTIEEIKALLQSATPGQWLRDDEGSAFVLAHNNAPNHYKYRIICSFSHSAYNDMKTSYINAENNMALVIAAPSVIQQLLDKVEALESEIRELQDRHGMEVQQVMQERDEAVEAADSLTYQLFPVELVGEHSNGNQPWANALTILRDREAEES